MTDAAVALITAPPGTAEALARGLVEARLAACVQLDSPITSFYRWEGRLEVDQEVRLVVKTRLSLQPKLLEFLQAHHPYKVPQLVLLPAGGSPAYLEWWSRELGEAEEQTARL